METAFNRYTILILLIVSWTTYIADGKSTLTQKFVIEQDERLLFERQNTEALFDSDLSEVPDHDDDRIENVPWWTTFLMSLIMIFYRQREDNRSQFGVLYMGNIDNLHLNQFPRSFQPHNQKGNPVIDNRYAISPNNVNNYGNYLSTRPENVAGTMIHAEARILDNLDSLWNAYHNQNNRTPNFMLLYSWIMPCPSCTKMILSHFNRQPYSGVHYRVVAYTVEGTNSGLPYMTPESNNQSRNSLWNSGINVYRQRCNRPDDIVSTIRSELADIISKKTKIEKKIESQMNDDPDTHVCRLEDTFQGCMVDCLGDVCCSCKRTRNREMSISLVNELTKFCATSDITTCPLDWMNTYFSGKETSASSCTVFESVAKKVRECAATTCFGRPMSKPLDPRYPYYNPGYLINFSEINIIPKVDLTDFCQDIRAESLLCTTYRADSFTAGNTLCRSDNRCGYQDSSYSWCYVDFKNNWDYCCTGSCGFNDNTDYMWCRSGNNWQYCGNGGEVTIDNQRCLAEFPCGMHQEEGSEGYYWCYTDTKYWNYCCHPWESCSAHGYSYNWCYTGYKKQTVSKTCIPPKNRK